MKIFAASIALLVLSGMGRLAAQVPDTLELRAGLRITRSVVIRPGSYVLPGDSTGVVRIHGTGIRVDFSGALLSGAEAGTLPDQFVGVGILIEGGSNIEIVNARVRGYRVGLLARDVDSLEIHRSDFSYNYRQHLKSTLESENLDDWMSYHQNENDEWLRYGAAVYLNGVRNPQIHDVTITGGQNGIMLTRVEDGIIYNNAVTFNSGIGIGLYRSSRNRIQNNALDFNVRGYSHGVYNRGQDSAAILVYEQSNDNMFAYNSATHSGDGFFLWAGQSTMDTGEGGSNDNIIYGNDFSYAPTNGIEVTFSRNRIEQNRIAGCWHGIWGGYSFDTEITGNRFTDNEEHIAIEHGQRILIEGNTFRGGRLGVRAWERENQPADWGYARSRDVRSRDYTVVDNLFFEVTTPLAITETANLRQEGNTIESEYRKAVRGDAADRSTWFDIDFSTVEESPLPESDARSVLGSTQARLDRSYILVDDWGPYDFRSPVIWPRSPQRSREQTFEIMGPPGRWRLIHTNGVDSVSATHGKTGERLAVWLQTKDIVDLVLDMDFQGEDVTDRFGNIVPAGRAFDFSYRYFFVPIRWKVGWFAYDEKNDPRDRPSEFRRLIEGTPEATDTTSDLTYQFYRSPAPGLPADYFATVADGSFSVPEGDYVLEITSDDGVRVFLDGEKVFDDWTWHPPRQAEIPLHLDGPHRIRIEHFEIDGYATLVARLRQSSVSTSF